MAGWGNMAQESLAMIAYGGAPSVLLIADNDAAAARGRERIMAAGARIRDIVSVEQAFPFLDEQVAPSLAWAELGESGGGDFAALLARLDRDAEARRMAAVISAPLEMIDSVVAATPSMAVTYVCDPDAEACVEAIEQARRVTDPRVGEVSRPATPKLQHISQEINRLATLLAELSDEAIDGAGADDPARGLVDASTIRSIIRARRLRERFFPGDLFADPAWDMMLDLMAARLEDRRVAVSSLCIAAAVPPTTALRWIKTLTEAGLFRRVADQQDGRRVYVELTDTAIAAFERYLKAVPLGSGGLFV